MSAGAAWSVAPGAAPAGGDALAGSFTMEQVDSLRGERERLTVLLTVDGSVSLANGDRVGVRLDPLTGERSDVARVASVELAEAMAQMERDEDRSDLARLWPLCCKSTCPGKVWRIVREVMGRWGDDLATAWAMAWAVDASQLRDATEACGTSTREVVHVAEDGRRHVGLSRNRCGSSRCPHCGVLVVGHRWKTRLEAQAARDVSAGRPWAMLTLTLDPSAWCEAHGVGPGLTAAVMAQRWVGRAFADLARDVRRRWPGTEMLRAIELHDSMWPHVHVLVRGALVEAMREEGSRWPTWDSMAAYAMTQRTLQRAGKLKVARCPTPKTRKAVAALATKWGFGKRLDLAPIAAGGMAKTAAYVAKGPQATGKAKTISDADAGAVPGELSKGRQRVGRLLARGVRCWAEAGAFLEVREEERQPSEGIESVRVLPTPLDVLVRELRAAGEEVGGAVVMVDFAGPVPDQGQQRPRVLEAVTVGASPVELLAALGRAVVPGGDAGVHDSQVNGADGGHATRGPPARRPGEAGAQTGGGASPGHPPRPSPHPWEPPQQGPPNG